MWTSGPLTAPLEGVPLAQTSVGPLAGASEFVPFYGWAVCGSHKEHAPLALSLLLWGRKGSCKAAGRACAFLVGHFVASAGNVHQQASCSSFGMKGTTASTGPCKATGRNCGAHVIPPGGYSTCSKFSVALRAGNRLLGNSCCWVAPRAEAVSYSLRACTRSKAVVVDLSPSFQHAQTVVPSL